MIEGREKVKWKWEKEIIRKGERKKRNRGIGRK